GLVVHDALAAEKWQERLPILLVADTLQALGDFAAAWRTKCPARRIAVVGSSGKTTTKEMLACILRHAEGKQKVLATQGNLNNLIGLPQTLLRLEPTNDWAVLELGMNLPGELRRLTQIARPDMLLLLNVGIAHIGMFNSLKDLILAKADSVRGLAEDVPIIYDADSANTRTIIQRWAGKRPLASFSLENAGDVRGENIRVQPREGYRFDLLLGDCACEVLLPIFGRYNVRNAVAAAAVAWKMRIEPTRIVEALATFEPCSMRSEIRRINNVTFVVDCYNANPDSMGSALQSLEEWRTEGSRTVLILGQMLELGDQSEAAHGEILQLVKKQNVGKVLLYGEAFRQAVAKGFSGDRLFSFCETHEEIAENLHGELEAGDLVFVKGSRGCKLEKVLELPNQMMA
ncbi:UDP-N-acetylmuramoyl-tripeptide--D-alanyl-D-alanine ligase, partial [bacterium]|nr:UDP-N-acetylmuramoyl-tripeptide--D-alanyl-D-alanine ligase [bacterium]